MHRKPEAELLPLDTELERTLRNMKKVRFVEQEPMADQREEQPEVPAYGTTALRMANTIKLNGVRLEAAREKWKDLRISRIEYAAMNYKGEYFYFLR